MSRFPRVDYEAQPLVDPQNRRFYFSLFSLSKEETHVAKLKLERLRGQIEGINSGLTKETHGQNTEIVVDTFVPPPKPDEPFLYKKLENSDL